MTWPPATGIAYRLTVTVDEAGHTFEKTVHGLRSLASEIADLERWRGDLGVRCLRAETVEEIEAGA